MEAKEFWAMIQDKHAMAPPGKRAPEGASCGTCKRYENGRCTLKKKAVDTYRICGSWKERA